MSLFRDEGNVRGALVALERSLRHDPGNGDAQLLLGQIYGLLGSYGRAEPHLRRAMELLEPLAKDDPDKRISLDEAKNSLAAALLNLGRPQEAAVLAAQVARDERYPQPHLALGNLGWAYLQLHRYREAAQVLERAVSLQGDFCVGSYRLGEAYLRLDEYGRALTALNRALGNRGRGCDRIQPALRARGEVHARLHQPDAAREDFTRCRELAPDTSDGRACAASLRTAEVP